MTHASLDALLTDAVTARAAPGLVALVGDRERVLFAGAAGRRDEQEAMTRDTVFSLASCTKLVTAVAALQCVERGLVALDEPVDALLPALADYQVLTGFGEDGAPQFRAPTRRITLRHLLAHNSGLGYEFTDAALMRARGDAGPPPTALASLCAPLRFDPGEGWLYGIGSDWAGLVVEAASGRSLEDWFAAEIFEPLGMRDTGFAGPAPRRAQLYARAGDAFVPIPHLIAEREAWEYASGGGGLFGTADDYLRLLQAVLAAASGTHDALLGPAMAELLFVPQSGSHRAGAFDSTVPAVSARFDLLPEMATTWSLGGMVNPQAVPGGRRAGSLGWAGIANTHYWVDREAGLCAVLMAQYLPFADPAMIATLRTFETAAYESFAPHM